MATKPKVFIIESLHPDDEGNDKLEGKNIAHLLKLHGKRPKYKYVRTKKEFEKAIKQFGKSNYRYLHISAHGDKDGLCTTNQDEISNLDLSKLLKPHLEGKRLFISACSMVNKNMAKEMILRTKCRSVVGPKKDIYFSDAVVCWQLIYHLMFSENSKSMSDKQLRKTLLKVQFVMPVRMSLFLKSDKNKQGYTGDLLKTDK